MPFLDSGSLPDPLFGFGPFCQYFVSLTSAAFGTNSDHTFPKLGCDIIVPEFSLLSALPLNVG